MNGIALNQERTRVVKMLFAAPVLTSLAFSAAAFPSSPLS
jgi:hypothetical protein